MKYWRYEESDGPFKATSYESRRELVDSLRSEGYVNALILPIVYKLELYGYAVVESFNDKNKRVFHTDLSYRIHCLQADPFIDEIEAGMFVQDWVAEEDETS